MQVPPVTFSIRIATLTDFVEIAVVSVEDPSVSVILTLIVGGIASVVVMATLPVVEPALMLVESHVVETKPVSQVTVHDFNTEFAEFNIARVTVLLAEEHATLDIAPFTELSKQALEPMPPTSQVPFCVQLFKLFVLNDPFTNVNVAIAKLSDSLTAIVLIDRVDVNVEKSAVESSENAALDGTTFPGLIVALIADRSPEAINVPASKSACNVSTTLRAFPAVATIVSIWSRIGSETRSIEVPQNRSTPRFESQ